MGGLDNRLVVSFTGDFGDGEIDSGEGAAAMMFCGKDRGEGVCVVERVLGSGAGSILADCGVTFGDAETIADADRDRLFSVCTGGIWSRADDTLSMTGCSAELQGTYEYAIRRQKLNTTYVRALGWSLPNDISAKVELKPENDLDLGLAFPALGKKFALGIAPAPPPSPEPAPSSELEFDLPNPCPFTSPGGTTVVFATVTGAGGGTGVLPLLAGPLPGIGEADGDILILVAGTLFGGSSENEIGTGPILSLSSISVLP